MIRGTPWIDLQIRHTWITLKVTVQFWGSLTLSPQHVVPTTPIVVLKKFLIPTSVLKIESLPQPSLYSKAVCPLGFICSAFSAWNIKGLCLKLSNFNPRLYGRNGLTIWSFKKVQSRIISQMSKIGCACAFLPVFAQSAISIYTQRCHIKGQISAKV